MIISEHQRTVTQEIIERAAARDAAGEEAGPGAQAMHAQIVREAGMWDAGIREPVPDEPQSAPIDPMPTREEIQAMDDTAYAAYSRRVTLAAKRAQIANIDRQIGIALDRIADWRRHRAWLEREIAELEHARPAPRQEVSA